MPRRWDAELTSQVWTNCGDVTVVAAHETTGSFAVHSITGISSPVPNPHAASCCWSRWGTTEQCGGFPAGTSGGHCNTDWTKTCNSNNDCPATPVTPPPPPKPTGPNPPPPPSSPPPPPSLPVPPHTPTKIPARMMGMYVLLADDTDKVYTSTHNWTPKLYQYQAKGTNTLFFTFLNPARMPAVPPAFAALAKTRGTNESGAVPNGTTIMFAIGGQAYSERPNPWDWCAKAGCNAHTPSCAESEGRYHEAATMRPLP